MIKVSVIMPVYNSETYLQTAIDSVLGQSLTELELILIDDGSLDGSGGLCDENAGKDKRVKVIHQKNQGISRARNRGIEAAQGQYIAFMDNDDFLLKDILQKSYHIALEESADIVKFGYEVEENFSGNFREKREMKAHKFLSVPSELRHEMYFEVKQTGYFYTIWNGIYSREFLIENNIQFDEQIIQGYEDWKFNYMCYPVPGRQIIIPEIGYVHYQRLEHSTSKKFHPNQLLGLKLAAEQEEIVYRSFGESDYLNIWGKRSIEYIIEYLMLFQRQACDMKIKSRRECMLALRKDPLFKILLTGENIMGLTKPQRLVIHLWKRKQILIILYLSRCYHKYIMYKKKHSGRKERN